VILHFPYHDAVLVVDSADALQILHDAVEVVHVVDHLNDGARHSWDVMLEHVFCIATEGIN
jgi:hypothetical protein